MGRTHEGDVPTEKPHNAYFVLLLRRYKGVCNLPYLSVIGGHARRLVCDMGQLATVVLAQLATINA